MSDNDAEKIMDTTPQAGFMQMPPAVFPMQLMTQFWVTGMRNYARTLEQGAAVLQSMTPRT